MAITGGIGALFGGAASLGELGLGIAGAVSGSPASNVPMPSPLSGVGGAVNSGLSGIGNLGAYNLYGPNIGQYSTTAQSLFNNPYASLAQSGAGTAGNMATGAAGNMYGAGSNLYGAGNTVLNTGFDPQSSLYNYLQNQNTQQSNAENAMAGVANTPYGAGVTDMSNMQFNMNWQNQQLMRQLEALQGAGGAYSGAAGLQSQAPTEYLYGAGLPYGTFNTIGGNQLGTLERQGQFGAAGQGVANVPIQDNLNYALGAQGANTNLGQLGLNQAQLGFNQTQSIGQGIGSGLGGLAGMGMGWGTGPWSPYQMGAYDPATMGPISPSGLVNP